MRKIFLILLFITTIFSSRAVELKVDRVDSKFIPRFTVDDNDVLLLPKDGQWSVALSWDNDWPDNWYHTYADSIERLNDWTILHGRIELQNGIWLLRDAYRKEGEKIKCIRRYEWVSDYELDSVTLSLRWQTPIYSEKVFMPSILYYGNPSGYKNGGNMPTFNKQNAPYALFEEHRFSMPFVSVEFEINNHVYSVGLHSIPSTVPYGNVPDQWWSLGAIALDNNTEVGLFSGPVAWNNKMSYAKSLQRGKDALRYGDTYMNVEPGAIIEKTFFIEASEAIQHGAGFMSSVDASLDIFRPFYSDDMPTFQQIIKDKYKFAESRYIENEKSAGFSMYPISLSKKFVFGWCGQAASLGYAMQNLYQFIDDDKWNDKIQKSLDHLTTSPFNETGFHLIYDVDNNTWSGQDFLSQGQGMYNFSKAIQSARGSSYFDISKWEGFIIKASDLHAHRVLNNSWYPISTNEGFLVAPLTIAYQLFGNQLYYDAASKIADHYIERHINMVEPYWGGTLDATGEDKEGAWAAFQAFISMYDISGDEKYLKAAEHAAYVTLSYTVVWDIQMPPSRLGNYNFKTRGWTTVSPQNMHLDVYGVNYAPWLYKLGLYLNKETIKKISLLMYRSCGQMIDPYGSHGEQLQQTNFAQRGNMHDIYKFRGGYAEDWTVFWITAHFLNAAAHFMELDSNIVLSTDK